ncbi:MAG: serine/threonine-protein kinase, partial [Polyangiales bacterium]
DIFSFGQLADGRHYYVMEMLEGEPLDQYLARTGPIPLAEAVPILKAIAKALDAAHAKGIAHRDLKPENIFLARDSEGDQFPKLLDFGIAKLMTPEEQVKHRTATGAPIGTPYYMSPEQCRGKDVDHRTDIYSLGIVAYRLLTGEYPFEGDGYLDLMMMQISAEAAPPSSRNPALSPTVDAAIAAMMRKDPNERPRSVAAAVAAMAGGGDLTPALTPSTLSERRSAPRVGAAITGTAATQLSTPSILLSETPRSRRSIWISVAVGVLAAAVLTTFLVTRRDPEPAEPAKPTSRVADPAPPPIVPPAKPAMAVTAPPDAPGPAKIPGHVIITIEGAPEGAEVKMGATSVGYAPMVQLEGGTSPVILTFLADGFTPGRATVTPDHDQIAKVTMKKRARATSGQAGPGKDDIIHVVPGLTP